MTSVGLASLMEGFFTKRLIAQLRASAAHDCLLPGHVPSAVAVCQKAIEASALETHASRLKRAVRGFILRRVGK